MLRPLLVARRTNNFSSPIFPSILRPVSSTMQNENRSPIYCRYLFDLKSIFKAASVPNLKMSYFCCNVQISINSLFNSLSHALHVNCKSISRLKEAIDD